MEGRTHNRSKILPTYQTTGAGSTRGSLASFSELKLTANSYVVVDENTKSRTTSAFFLKKRAKVQPFYLRNPLFKFSQRRTILNTFFKKRLLVRLILL